MSSSQIPDEINAVRIFTSSEIGFECDPLESRDILREYLDGAYLAVDEDNQFLQHELADLLNTHRYKKIGSFFDRDPSILDWYYSVYARDTCAEPLNAVAAIVCGKEQPRGPVVVVKDGPAGSWKGLKTGVDVDEVAKTLWYYRKSGVSVEQEFGERTLLRILSS